MSTKPIELQNAIIACETAWDNYDKAVEANQPKEVLGEYWKVVNIAEDRRTDIYNAWQSMGGTSDIESLHPVDEAQRIERGIDAELGTRVIISGGEVLELGTSGTDNIPF